MSGYNYDRLYKYAEMVAEKVKANKRVNDVGIELGSSDYWQSQGEPTSEMYIKYDMEKIALNRLNLGQCYSTLAALMDEGTVGTYRNKDQRIAIDYHSSERDNFDVWHLMNSYLTAGDRQICYANIGEIGKRNAAARLRKITRCIRCRWLLILWDRMICRISLSKRQPKRLMLFCLSVSGRLTRVSGGTMIEVPNIG